MTSYQDVVNANLPFAAWALPELSGTDFAPYAGTPHLTGAGVTAYQQAGPFANSLSLTLTNGKLVSATGVPFSKWFGMEAWFKPSGSTSAGTRLLLYLGVNSAADGWGVYLPTGSNTLHIFYANPVRDITTAIVLPVGSWTLVQIGNLSGTTGEIDVAINGQLLAQDVSPSSQTINNTSFGFGGESAHASNYSGGIALPAVYVGQQSALNFYSRFLASTDPTSAVLDTVTGLGQLANGSSGLLGQILAAVKHTYSNA